MTALPPPALPPVAPMTEADFDPAWQMLEEAFLGAGHPDDRDVERAVVDLSRFLVAHEQGQLVATAGSFAFSMTLPGASVPVAGVTWVGVRATHRRRGLLTALMPRLLRERYEAGESVAALWASEAAIYHRYGFGAAAWQLSAEVPRGAAFVRPVERGGLGMVAPDRALLAPVYERVAAARPGWFTRDDAFWAYRLHDPEHRRDGGGPLRCLVTEQGDGYALYATVDDYGPTGPQGRVRVRELAAATPDAAARLWRFLLDLDLTGSVTARLAPDDPLLHLLAEPRTAGARLADALWARPLEVGGALSARRYAAPVDVVLDVRDATCPWNAGRWRLSGDADGATCAPTSDAADLSLDVSDLGAALLGGSRLHTRAAAGSVQEHRQGALAAASAAFGPLGAAPSCPMVF